ncbi:MULTISPECIES: DNA polymerase III subunit delta' [Dickeya]|uniref:DNA polymerase III subunit delta' n=1 Tax=Dickeya aquatica TaxID=1401087 RepID=A0A375ACN9_9GAMM|nr:MULTISPECIES: DNA polymerase III subunit delta' [Dickeya]SLM63686.1 DNA polymerase III delta prime subunit [Dickeya aquatica]
MEWYPWLNVPYRQWLASHQAGRGHHAVLLHAPEGMGEASLVYALGRRLLCRHPEGGKSCGRCHDCQLMRAGTHPDWHPLVLEKGKQSLGVDQVREVVEQVYQRSRQGGVKIVWLAQAELLTEAAANALLKTLEEPPADSYFLLGCREPGRLLATLRSRCLYHYLDTPDETQAILWLRTRGQSDDVASQTALRLSHGAPLAALALLQPERWKARAQLCQQLSYGVHRHDALSLLALLHHDEATERIHWVCSVWLDALKWRHQARNSLINRDQLALIAQWGEMHDEQLHYSLRRWLQCRHQLLSVTGVNRELLLTSMLLDWERALSSPQRPVLPSFS